MRVTVVCDVCGATAKNVVHVGIGTSTLTSFSKVCALNKKYTVMYKTKDTTENKIIYISR